MTVGPIFDAAPRPGKPTIRLAPYAGVAGAQMLHIVPEGRYPSTPPTLHGYRCASPKRDRWFNSLLARGDVACPAEAVMLYRDAFLLDGKQVLASDTTAVAESYANMRVTEAVVAHHHAQLARIARGDLETIAEAGPPVVAIFNEACMNYGHVLVESLPRLLHLEAAGIRRMRLALPAEAETLRPMIGFALAELGLEAAFMPCPAGSIMRVPALHWVSSVARHEYRKSPTLRRLAERLRAAVPVQACGARLYVARPDGARRRVTNAHAIAAIAEQLGYRVVEPSGMPFGAQVALFAGAGVVAGPMGAALTSICLMAPGGRVAMFEGGNCDPFFWDLACLSGHAFHWAFTAPATEYDTALLDREMTIDPAMARHVLSALAG
ncbi:MAG: glycosyltransferase family 61 protein [Acetobacteraceae bacterium]|nr:glycosyltransferase family 61 protein [Acetobacteraceae bacterium]